MRARSSSSRSSAKWSGLSTIVSDRQLLYATDYVDGSNNLVVLDLMTGDELYVVAGPG